MGLVEVLLEKESFAATVLTVHGAEKVHVVYDVDSSVGIFLSAAVHGLNKLWIKLERGGRRFEGGKKQPPLHNDAQLLR